MSSDDKFMAWFLGILLAMVIAGMFFLIHTTNEERRTKQAACSVIAAEVTSAEAKIALITVCK